MCKLSYRKVGCILFVLVLAFYSCKTHQKITKTTEEKAVVKEPATPAYSIVEMDYQWFTAHMNARILNTLTQKEMGTVALFLVTKKDSIIYINASKMAIELGRVVLTPDSVKYINHLNSTYYIGNYNILKRLLGFPVDFYMIQSLLMNADFVDFNENFLVESRIDKTILRDKERKHKKSFLIINQEIVLNDNDRIIENRLIEKVSGDSATFLYGDFFNVTSVNRMPKTLDIDLISKKIRVYLTLKDAKLNVPGPSYFKIPAKYTLLVF
ncbi:MAG: DUF4292 domain-containing protein [Bacteroidales bacterium]|jgi:hypothetical protein|nr:DUF4292 domain-containing protein [Bacteroidales bacterium]